MDYSDVAKNAIELFIEYRDDHGYSEIEAKNKAVREFQEYELLCDSI